MIDLAKITGFDWDQGNLHKSLKKHKVEPKEAEQIFFDEFVLIFKDEMHSAQEERFHALGQTQKGRHLQVSFTLRRDETYVRVISARDMDERERACYD